MRNEERTREELINELAELNQRVAELQASVSQLKEAEEALRESEEKFRTVFMSAPVGIAIARPRGRFVSVNESFCRMLGFTEKELQKKTFIEITHPEDRELTRELAREVMDTERSSYEMEKRYLTKEAQPVLASMRATAIKDTSGQTRYWLGIIEDITERKRAEEALQMAHHELEYRIEERAAELIAVNDQLKQEIQERKRAEKALRESEERFRLIFEKSNDAICVIDQRGTYAMVNDAMCHLTGVSRGEIVGEHYSAFTGEETQEMTEDLWSREELSESDPSRCDFKLFRRDGEVRIVENIPTVIHEPDKAPFTVAILRDITAQRRMQDQLEGMRSKLLQIQENERSRIARVLHDTIGQNIGILDFNLATIEEILDEESRKRIASLNANMRSVIRDTGDKLRDIASGLHPREIQEFGLFKGIDSFIKRLQRRTRLKVNTSVQVERLEIEENVAINLYRIIQEAFTNIIRHSKCQSVDFQLTMDNDCLLVRIHDDGIGFSPKEVSGRDMDHRGMGLFIIHERARAINAKIQIHSEPNQGTQIQLDVPLE